MEERLNTGWTDSERSWWTALTASGWRPALTLTLARLGGELTSADSSTSLTSSSPPLRVYLVFLWSYHSFFSVCTYGCFIIFLWSFQSDLDKPTPTSSVGCSGLSSSSVLDPVCPMSEQELKSVILKSQPKILRFVLCSWFFFRHTLHPPC